jgi:SpoVK/Ycf46/Vps4 family AAA+-type ATPase
LKLPSGLLLLGVSGTGKSLTSEAIAAHWQLPLLNFDVGRAFGGVLGETESNIREVIAVAEATAPCVLRIDEIEKGLGGDSLDGGTSQRVLATLLNWLENKPENVFVIATANDIRALSKRPELLQRFSESFFVDLPDMRSRIEILSIHLAPKHSIPADDLVDIAKVLKGYSGREIRNVVRKGLAAAFKSGAKHPSCSQMMAAAKLIVPTSHTLREQITELRKWCLDGRAIPAGATLEADNKDEQSFKVDGLPDLGN